MSSPAKMGWDPLAEVVWSPQHGLTVNCFHPDSKHASHTHHITGEASSAHPEDVDDSHGSVESCKRRRSFDHQHLILGCKRIKTHTSFINIVKPPPLHSLPLAVAHQTVTMMNNKSKEINFKQGMFHIIRSLRLSRTDIIRWMNSEFSTTNLNGFFVRLRLAKWEEELGGVGYHVACIIGSGTEIPSKGSMKPIRVDIGDIKCLVEMRYISNYDFHEEELVGWWEKVSKEGGVPAVQDLKSKLEERKRMGF